MSSSSPSPPKNRDKSHRTVFKKRSIPLDISHLPKQTINKTEDEMMCNHVTTSSLIDSGVGDYVPKLINTYNSDLNNDSKKHEYEDQQTLICPFGDVLLNPGDNDDTHDIKNTGLDFNIVNEINTTIIISKENVKGKSNATYSNVSENDEPSHRNMLLSRTNLYIKGLSKITTDKDLLDLCHRFGNIISTKAILDKETNLCKGFGFVDFEDADSAQTALKELRSSGSQVQMAKQQSLDSTNLYIANLPPHMQERDLEKMISPYGPVLSIRILKEMGNNLKSRGVGFARMESRSCCERVISNINGKIVEGSNKPLLCKFADNASHNNLNINYTNSIHNAQTNKSIQRNRLGQGTHHPLSNNPTFPGLNRSNYLFHNIEHIKNNLTNNNNQDIYYYPQSAQIYQPHLNHPPNTLAAGMGSNLNLNRNTYFNKQLFGRNSLYSDNGNKQQQYATLHQPQFYLTPQYLNPSINLNYGSPSALFYQPIPTNVKAQNLQQHPQYQLNSPQTVPINSPILYYYYYPVVPPNAINSNSYASQNNQTPILNKLEESSDTFGVNEKIDNTPDDDQYIDKDVIASRTIQKIGDESIQKIEKNMGKEKNIDFNKIHAEGSTLADHKNYHSYYRFDLSLANTPAINSILEQNIINTSAHSKSLNSFSQTDNQKFLNRRFSKTLTSVNNSLKRDGNKVKDS
ncbi:uncharacterized protein DDB_G0283357-like isoform X5 [Gordionus sp. m RMFG-2023]|uniref:uncharacterized protein DDB_G0283357-like isoform X5 n=1 Tax=Gordionus sp. m RMFG-2023 TaxID=3053472 RepID=UPI0031FD6A24